MSIYSAAKDAAKILKEAGKIEEYQKILDLIDDLFQKREEIEQLKKINNGLEEKLRVTGGYEFRNNAYYSTETKDGPFCSRCFDKNKELIRIIPMKIGSSRAKCHECGSVVNYTGNASSSQFHQVSRNRYQ